MKIKLSELKQIIREEALREADETGDNTGATTAIGKKAETQLDKSSLGPFKAQLEKATLRQQVEDILSLVIGELGADEKVIVQALRNIIKDII